MKLTLKNKFSMCVCGLTSGENVHLKNRAPSIKFGHQLSCNSLASQELRQNLVNSCLFGVSRFTVRLSFQNGVRTKAPSL